MSRRWFAFLACLLATGGTRADEPPSALTNEQVGELIGALADPARAHAASERLEEDMPRARARLLAALDDPALFIAQSGEQRPAVLYVLDLLSHAPDAVTLTRVRGLVEHRLKAVRVGAGRVLGCAAAEEDVQRLCRLLADEDEAVRRGVVDGLSRCHDDRGLPERVAKGVASALLDLLPGLDARADATAKYGDPRATVLQLLGRVTDPRVDEALRRYSTCANEYTAYVAAKARCDRLGLDADRVAFDAVGDDPRSASVEHRTYCLAVALDAQVTNGGFRQFYGNGSGAYAVETIDALKTIGATTCATLLERANAEFGPAGPPRDDEARDALLGAMTRKADEQFLFGSYDDAYYASREPVMALVHLYVLAHPDAFRPR